MATKTVEFLFDFGSPNAYLAHRVIPAIEARTGAAFIYTPVLLGGVFKATGNRSPMEAFAAIPAKLAYEALETRRFVALHGLTRYRLNAHFPVNTLAIMRGSEAARDLDVFAAYVEAVFAAMWEDGRKMDDPAVVAETLSASGLPAERLMALAQDQAVKDRLLANTQRAVERGVFGSPSFFVGGELYFGKDRLRDVEAAITASGLYGVCPTQGPLMGLFLGREPFVAPTNFVEAKALCENGLYRPFFHALLERGVALAPGAYEILFVSLAHSADDLNVAVEKFGEAAKVAARS